LSKWCLKSWYRALVDLILSKVSQGLRSGDLVIQMETATFRPSGHGDSCRVLEYGY
jgi:hypothetical protein